MSILLNQVETSSEGVLTNYEWVSINVVFVAFLVMAFVSNIIKRYFVWTEKKRGTLLQPCTYLCRLHGEQDCDHPTYREQFKLNGCKECPGKISELTDIDAEKRIIQIGKWKCSILLLANFSKNMLPYISMLYTLIIAIVKNSK